MTCHHFITDDLGYVFGCRIGIAIPLGIAISHMTDLGARWPHSCRRFVFTCFLSRVQYANIARAVVHAWNTNSAICRLLKQTQPQSVRFSCFRSWFFNGNVISHVCFGNKGSATSPTRAAFFTSALLFQALNPLVESVASGTSDVAVAMLPWHTVGRFFSYCLIFRDDVFFLADSLFLILKAFFLPWSYNLLCCVQPQSDSFAALPVFRLSLTSDYCLSYSMPPGLCGWCYILSFV